ncbi:5392_t:CDS:2 [Cetraspora pellucida]|uniref:5392_t:CDS:1 n=1 Tax=Cetraspora pellucida TaxID=1433469 RepID=A0A9N9J4T5_9GLOM|nr:5392_t:CDS:2 [Cetraspora pellucida]
MSSPSFSDNEESNVTPSMASTSSTTSHKKRKANAKDVMNLLESIERVTRHLCGAKYPTINLVYLYMELLKKTFAPKTDETVDTYLNLIYEEVESEENESDESDNDISTAGTKYLPSVATDGLLCKVQAAIYLSLDELWAVPMNIALVAMFLDSRFKHFNWATSVEQNRAQDLVKTLYNELKINLTISDDNEENLVDSNYNDDNADFFYELESNSIQVDVEDDDEVTSSLPVLAQLARKYLSILATSVPSERLFSDAGNHISAKRTCLSPDLVNKVLFLKCNRVHFEIFPPQE